MATIDNVRLINHVRADALKLIEIRRKRGENLTYDKAFELAKQNLIGESKITEFIFQPLSVTIDIPAYDKENIQHEQRKETNFDPMYQNLRRFINVEDYAVEQLKQYNIAVNMNVDITKFANPAYSPEQIKFLSIMSASKKDISTYIGNYSFNPEEAFKMATENEKINQKTKQYTNDRKTYVDVA